MVESLELNKHETPATDELEGENVKSAAATTGEAVFSISKVCVFF